MEPGSVVSDRFVVEGRAASGGMSTVYRARDQQSGELVALKVLRAAGERSWERFEREVALIEQLPHAGIARHVAHGRTPDGQAYLALEWLEGEDLEARLSRGPLCLSDTLLLIRTVAQILGFVHAHGVVHRDLKPANVFLVQGALDRVRLLDFGIARWVGASTTRTGALVGTPQYMAPEQVRGVHSLDSRCDVFALGVLVFECLVGRPPFLADTVMGTLGRILFEEAPRLGELAVVPPELDALCARMLDKEPERRPPDARAVARELELLPSAQDPLLSIRPRLTTREQRFVCVLLTGEQGEDSDATLVDRSSPHAVLEAESRDTIADVRPRSLPPASAVVRLANGARALTLTGEDALFDLANKAARAALELHKTLGSRVPIALATGRTSDGGVIVGDAIDRANLLLGAPASGIRLDDLTAGLLDVRFVVASDEHGFYLQGERAFDLGARTLLGRTTPCVGRARELATLLSAFEECVDEPGSRALVVTGEVGAGKTRLAHELVRELAAKKPRPTIWRARGDVVAQGSPFNLLAGLVRNAAALSEDEPPEAAQKRLRARVMARAADEAERIALFLGELVGVRFSDPSDVQLRAARQDAGLLGDQLRRAFSDFVASECRQGPLVLLLDDLQWGDTPSVQALDQALRVARHAPLFVVALARPEVRAVFPKLWQDRSPESLGLAPLGKKAVGELAKHVLGDAARPELVADLARRAQGNAFFVEELLRAHASGSPAPPESLLAVVEARLAGLDAETRRVLRAASVFGDSFWPEGVRALLGDALDLCTVEAILGLLTEKELVSRSEPSRFADQRQFAFRHSLLREACLAMLTPDDLGLGHRLAATWLERAGESDALTLAAHWQAGGEPLRAAENWLHAAEEALAGNDYAVARERARAALAPNPASRLRVRATLVEIEASALLGEPDHALGRSLELASELEPGSRDWQSALLWALIALSQTTERAALPAIADRIMDAVPAILDRARDEHELGPPHLLLLRICNMFLTLGQAERSAAIIELVTQRGVEASLEPIERAFLSGARGRLRRDLWQMALAAREAAQGFEQSGDLRRAAQMRLHDATTLSTLGAHEEADQVATRGSAVASDLGLGELRISFEAIRARSLSALGRRDEAIELATQVMLGAQGQQRRELMTCLAELHIGAGQPERALLHAHAALDGLDPESPLCPFALALVARAELLRARPDVALPIAREAQALLRARGVIDAGAQHVALALALALLANGEVEAARAAVAEAERDLESRAARIGDAALARSFVERVPENVELRELSRQLSR